MKYYILIGTAFVVVVIICVAVIHYEGEQTRSAIRESTSRAVSDGLNQSINQVATPESVNDALGKLQSILGGDDGPISIKNLPDMAAPATQTAKDVLGEAQELLGDVLRRGSSRNDTPNVESSREDSARKPNGEGAPKSDSPLGGIFDEIRSAAGVKKDDEKPESKPSDEKDTKPADGKTSNSDDKPAKTDEDQSADSRKRTTRGEELLDGVFEIARRTTESGDKAGRSVFGLSTDDERRWGKRLHDEVTTDAKVVRDAAVNERVKRVAAPLLKTLLRPEIEYTFTVLQSDKDDLNAFSLPGGYVYVHSALLDFVENDEELQFVLGHEIGHIDLKHCVNKLTYSARVTELTAPIVGDAVAVLHNLLSRAYTQDEEYDADHYGFVAVIAAGQTRDQALAFPRRFGRYLSDKGLESTSSSDGDSALGRIVARAQNHFNTHPSMAERLKRLEAIDVDAVKAKAANARRESEE